MVVVGNDGYVDEKLMIEDGVEYNACCDDLDRVDVIRTYTGDRPDLVDNQMASY